MAKSQKHKRNPTGPKASSDLDALIGAKIRRLRTEAGISQAALAKGSAITFQQVQKYENGQNRVSVSRLAQIAATLDVPLASFFEDFPDLRRERAWSSDVPLADEPLARQQGLRLIKAFLSIENQAVRAKLVSLVAAVAHGDNGSDDVHYFSQ